MLFYAALYLQNKLFSFNFHINRILQNVEVSKVFQNFLQMVDF